MVEIKLIEWTEKDLEYIKAMNKQEILVRETLESMRLPPHLLKLDNLEWFKGIDYNG